MILEFDDISSVFLSELEKLRVKHIDVIELSENCIKLCRNVLNRFRKKIIDYDFESLKEEIDFFKYTKQIPLVPLIYYSEVRSFEIQFPKANLDSQKKYTKRKINKINRFFLYNMDFIRYVESNSTHLDQQYFTRDYLDTYIITYSKFYFQDPEFSTARDMLLGKVKAYQMFIDYLQKRLLKNGKVTKDRINGSAQIPSLKWTASKTALTELVYALHSNRAINNGNVDIKEIATTLQHIFHYDLGDFYKTYSEIKSRKVSRTKFLDELSSALLSQMDKAEE
ncbi:RteC domain-containing protein [Aequorivita nionensis]|uniref:RteC domain-containing protein n=1 Tax=Aequorivita nionensis TaxID=1287690 RepID=UPI003965928E